MIVDQVQRWTLGREHRRPAGEVIRRSEWVAQYDVEPIAEDSVAREYVKLHHYEHEASSTAHRFGLYRRGGLVGVALFGPPASTNAHRKVFPGLAFDEAVTLGRLVMDEDVPGNGEGLYVGRCLELLANPALYRPVNANGPRRPIAAIETCADPVVRTNEHGRRVFPGHGGTIYQALGMRHVGRTRAETKWLLPNGTVLTRRAMSKVTGKERGWQAVVAKLVRLGADPLDPEADRAGRLAWIQRCRAVLMRDFEHDGNLRYVQVLPLPRVRRRDELARFGAHVRDFEQHRRRAVLERFKALPYPKIDLLRGAA